MALLMATRQPYTKVTIPMTMRKLQELQKKWPRKVNNLTYSPHGICVLFRLNWFHGSSKDEYIHCFMTLQELQKRWPRKVNNLTYSPHGISVLFRLNWFHGSSKDEYIHCFMTFPWLLLFKPVRSWVQTTFSNWKLFSSWRSPLNC